MKLHNQVCTLEQAIKLKDLGIEQNSLFYYTQDKTPLNPNMVLYGWPQKDIPVNVMYGKQSELSTSHVFAEYSAFTESELAVMMDSFYETYIAYDSTWKCKNEGRLEGFSTPCEASADTLIWLLENDERMAVNDCNERLNNY